MCQREGHQLYKKRTPAPTFSSSEPEKKSKSLCCGQNEGERSIAASTRGKKSRSSARATGQRVKKGIFRGRGRLSRERE